MENQTIVGFVSLFQINVTFSGFFLNLVYLVSKIKFQRKMPHASFYHTTSLENPQQEAGTQRPRLERIQPGGQ